MLTPPGHWITASCPIGSLNGVTSISAPVCRAARIAVPISVTKYPVRSMPYGYGTGVMKPNAEIVPTGVKINCEKVVLGVGVTCVTTFFDEVPPNVVNTLETKRSKSVGATYTCVESYCGPTATLGVDEMACAVVSALS